MDFSRAIKLLKVGQAIRPSGWRGYLKKEQDRVVNAFSSEGPYVVGSVVSYLGSFYKRVGTAGAAPYELPPSDAEHWIKLCDSPHRLVWMESASASGGSKNYLSTADVEGDAPSYEVFHTDAGQNMDFDGEVFTEMMFGEWVVGDIERFEAERLETTKRW